MPFVRLVLSDAFPIALPLLAAALLPATALAQEQIQLEPRSMGYYDAIGQGSGSPGSLNYFAGQLGVDERNFFTFQLPSNLGRITGLQLQLYNPPDGFHSIDGAERYALHDVTGDINRLEALTGGVAAFNDLGSGKEYGSRVFTDADNVPGGMFITIPLNADAVTDANAAIGRRFGIGGRITTLSGDVQYVFGHSGRSPSDVRLILTVVPEPAGLGLLAVPLPALRRRSWATRG